MDQKVHEAVPSFTPRSSTLQTDDVSTSQVQDFEERLSALQTTYDSVEREYAKLKEAIREEKEKLAKAVEAKEATSKSLSTAMQDLLELKEKLLAIETQLKEEKEKVQKAHDELVIAMNQLEVPALQTQVQKLTKDNEVII